MKPIIDIINQLCTLEEKTGSSEDYARPFSRIKQSFEEMGYSYHSPVNEAYMDTRTDLEATIIGENTRNLVITKVIKPLILKDARIIQRAVVIVESR
ncbi:MAG: hypothetical protein O9353_12385, partial [Bacteroidia bacterium]|nr:hypothetical protein [Bacteroidia bacterium]